MQADQQFIDQPLSFWANVRNVSEAHGYTVRRKKGDPARVAMPDQQEIVAALLKQGMKASHIQDSEGGLSATGQLLIKYFSHRATVLNEDVEPCLMSLKRAKEEFNNLKSTLNPSCPLPMNKQTGEKKTYAYFTGIINMLIEANLGGISVDYDPRELTKFSRGGKPISTFARRIDGAFPSARNPIAIWEIKEYYYTTTFGSRVADAIYETQLDGMEADLIDEAEGIRPYHYFMVDAYDTWWGMGKSYLCRILDLLHMGYIDEVLFGYEVIERLPDLVELWVAKYKS